MALSRSLFISVVLAVGCAAPGDEARTDSIVIDQAPLDLELRAGEVEPEFVPLLEALQASLAARDDLAARNVLARLYARQPEGRVLELAQAFERILAGRKLVESVRLELATQVHSSEAARYRVALWALNESPVEVTFRPGPATLTLSQTIVDDEGRERTNQSSRTSDELIELVLAPGEPVELSLLEFAPPVAFAPVAVHPDFEVLEMRDLSGGAEEPDPDEPANVLAVRYGWNLDLRAGAFLVGDERLPAQRVRVEPAERVWLARGLPAELVQPEEFVAALTGGEVSGRDLMQLAVRIPAEARLATLDMLEPQLDALGLDTIAAMAPALRWLSGDSRLGDDPSVWKAWIRERGRRRAAEEEGTPGLDLPRSESSRALPFREVAKTIRERAQLSSE